MSLSSIIFILRYYKCHKIKSNHGGSYADSPNWIKSKKTINSINKKDQKCFQFVVTVVLNYEETGKYAEGITKMKSFMNKYKWEEQIFHQKKMNGKN